MKLLELFQFLIGRLKTIEPIFQEIGGLKFQFLIGRLKTGVEKSLAFDGLIVSIPYR